MSVDFRMLVGFMAAFLSIFCGVAIIFQFAKLKKDAKGKSKTKFNPVIPTVPKIYITGDKHGNYKELIEFCRKNKTTFADTMIILGDSCFNYFDDERDEFLKDALSTVKITLFCLHGNKENRPQNIRTYRTKLFRGGIVYYEEKFPNILFAKDCEVYDFDGRSAIVLGGAHSVDKFYRIENELPWWKDEEPDCETKMKFEAVLSGRNNCVDYIFTHTVPLKYEPAEMFISNKKKKPPKKKSYAPDIDKSVERWLDEIEKKVKYEKWFCGHYHTDKSIGRIRIMFGDIKLLSEAVKEEHDEKRK